MDYQPESESQVSDDEQVKKVKSKTFPGDKKRTKSTVNKRKKKEPETEDTELLQIQTSRGVISHARPLFLKKWDGVSNSFELTEEQLRDLSPMLSVYWDYKCQNMNVITFVQIGSIEWFVYENDAIVIHEMFGKEIKKFSKFLMIHFWASELPIIKAELFKHRIPMHFMSEVDDWAYKNKNKIIKREVTEVINPAVYLEFTPEEAEPSQRFLVAIYSRKTKYGVAVIDCQTNRYYLEEVLEGDLRRVLNKFKPVEVVLAKGTMKEEKKLIKQVSNPYITDIEFDVKSLEEMVYDMKSNNGSKVFDTLLEMVCSHTEVPQKFQYYSCLMALDLSCAYFEKLGVASKIFPNAVINFVNFSQLNLKPVFDAQVYENLEVFELKDEPDGFGKKGTLYAYLNKCKTPSGCRKLRQWINTPLTDKLQIKNRQDAISDIIDNPALFNTLPQDLASLTDIESKVATIFHWVVEKQETLNIRKDKEYNQNNNPLIVKIKQIRELLLDIIKAADIIQKITAHHPHLNSKYLKQITSSTSKTTQSHNSFFGKISNDDQVIGIPQGCKDACEAILTRIVYDAEQELIKPQKGMVPMYDDEAEVVLQLYKDLKDELEVWKKKFDCSKICYCSARQRNEIQIPKGVVKDKHKSLHFSSSTMKVERYTTLQSESLTTKLVHHEEMMDTAMIPFLNVLIKDFAANKLMWDQLCETISQLDVLCNLAAVSQQMEVRCVPQFQEEGLEYIDGIHVGLAQLNKKAVRSSVKFGQGETVMLITGPNMGGKSTILRQTCLLAILAQIGCYVPARFYKGKIFDQIFCRIGASDRVVEGKSTFYVELEETKHIIEKATKDSLVVIDELGRGTSTFDGISIAVGTLRALIEDIGSLTLFSTHYSIVADEFTTCKQVRNKTVTYKIQENRLQFSYQLADGISERSFAQNVAKMVGIPQNVLLNAREKSEMITKESQSLRHLQETTKRFSDLLIQTKIV